MVLQSSVKLWGPRKTTSEESSETLLSPGSESSIVASSSHVCECISCGQVIQKNKSQKLSISAQWAVAICLLCTLVNCLVTIDGTCSQPSLSVPTIPKGQYNSLKRPSPFIGLEKLRRPTPPAPSTVLNYPQVIAQIDAQKPSQVFDDDPKRYMSHTGYVSPEDRRVKLSPSVSTIVQFRAIDFGMEECELNLKIPENMTSSLASFLISVDRLQTKKPIDTKTLTYSSSPNKLTTVANLELVPGKDLSWRGSFHCAWDDVLSFQLGCSDHRGFEIDACSLEWWQNKEEDNPSHGIFIVQRATL